MYTMNTKSSRLVLNPILTILFILSNSYLSSRLCLSHPALPDPTPSPLA